MKNFILVYNISGYSENGGGTYVEYFESTREMTEFINETNDSHNDSDCKFSIDFAGKILQEIPYKEVERVIKYEIDD